MDPFSIVLVVLGFTNAVNAAAYEIGLSKPMKNKIAQFNKQINEDTDLKNKLMTAYNTKNPHLVMNVLNSVPGGMANQVAKLEKQMKESVHNRNINELDKNISENTHKAGLINDKMPNPSDNIGNLDKAIWWEQEGKRINVSKAQLGTNKDKFKYRDHYGKEHIGNVESLNKWTYGQDHTTGIEKINNNKPGIIQKETK